MNKKERRLFEKLYWIIAEEKNEHHTIYFAKDILQSILQGENEIAENLIKSWHRNHMTQFSDQMTILVPPKQSEMIDEFEYKWRKHDNQSVRETQNSAEKHRTPEASDNKESEASKNG